MPDEYVQPGGTEITPTHPSEVTPSTSPDSGTGASAYDIWLANGHSGTEADFLDSLKGAKGDPGDPGVPGDPGPMAGQEITSTVITTPVNPSVSNTYVTEGQIVVPAGTPAHEVELVNGLMFQLSTGTNAVKTAIRVDVAMFDELNNIVAYNARTFLQDTDATNKVTQEVLPCKASLPATDVIKTYTVQVRQTNLLNGAVTTVLLGGAFPGRTLVARYR